MRIRRDISSIPFRSAGETWQCIVDLVTGAGSQDVHQLNEARGVIASIITDEHPAVRAIIVEGVGPQLRIYCRYGMKAIEDGGAVDPLTWNPTAGDWIMHVPCDKENIAWVTSSLTKTSPRIKVFELDEEERADDESSGITKTSRTEFVIDWNFKG